MVNQIISASGKNSFCFHPTHERPSWFWVYHVKTLINSWVSLLLRNPPGAAPGLRRAAGNGPGSQQRVGRDPALLQPRRQPVLHEKQQGSVRTHRLCERQNAQQERGALL